jgi:hypothetical protein
MPVTSASLGDVLSDDDLENDLPSVASSAAVELDNLARNKSVDLSAVRRLTSHISELSAVAPVVSPSALVVIHGAMVDSGWNPGANKVAELVRTAMEMHKQLTELLESPTQFKNAKTSELEGIKRFCLALSRRSLTGDQFIEDAGQRHPFRRLTGARP